MKESKDKLTARQERFVYEYMKDLNHIRAAEASGYGANARVIGRHLLEYPLVKAKIQELSKKYMEKLELSAELVLEEIARIAFANVTEFYVEERTKDGKINQRAKMKSELDRNPDRSDSSSAVSKIEFGKDAEGNTFIKKYEFHNKPAALASLSKYFGLFERDNEQKGKGVSVETILKALPTEVAQLVRSELIRQLTSSGADRKLL